MNMNLIVILLVFAVVGVIALLLNKFLNRKPMQAMSAARQQLIDQAKSLPDESVDRFFEESGLSSADRAAARSILEFLAKLLDVTPEKVARNQGMGKLFAIPQSGSELHPFATEIVEGLASLSDKQRWEQRWSETPDLPRNEDALVRFIMGMSVPQVLRFFAPLMKRS
jgi:hypothetical protein